MKIKQLIENGPDIEAAGISYNSQKTKKGDVFVAIKGFKSDGHDYALDAQKKGAVCVVCEREIPGLQIPCVTVENSRKALALMAHRFYGCPLNSFKLIGVTGTNGKTTVTYLIKSVLEQQGEKVGLIGTNQNMIGDRVIETDRTTPESLELVELFRQMADEGCTHVVMEVSSHSLELDRVAGCRFSAGAFTNLTQDHLDFHGTMENYFEAKKRLFGICDIAVINIRDGYGKRLAEMVRGICPVITYGLEGADMTAEDIVSNEAGISFRCGGSIFQMGIPGEFSVYNALAAISACSAVGIEMDAIAAALKNTPGVKGRLEIVPTGKDFTVIIDYAHTPDGLENLLKAVRGFAKGRIVLLFGCGGDRDVTKRPKMGKVAGELADVCIVTSDNPRNEEPAAIIRDILDGMKDASAEYTVVENRRDAIEYALKYAQPDDVVVLAGKGHETYQILKDSKYIHFDEREIIAEVLAL